MATPNMNLVLPTEGGSADVWDTLLNDIFDLIDAHDHTTGKGVKVPIAGLDIDAALAMGGEFITGAGALDFTAVAEADVAGLAGAFFVNSDDNDLYYRTVGGVNVKFTSGNAFNAALVGGIGGDYASAGALVDYVDSTDLYRFRQEDAGGRKWAGIQGGPLDIFEAGSLATNRVRLQSPAALAASYALTMPAALPASAAIVQMSTAGVISASIILPRAPGFTATEEIRISHAAATALLPAGSATPSLGRSGWSIGSGDTDSILYPISLPVGCRITAWSLRAKKQTNASTTISAALYRIDASGETQIGSTQSNAANNPGDINIGESSLTETVVTASEYLVNVESTAAGAGDLILELSVTFDRPT